MLFLDGVRFYVYLFFLVKMKAKSMNDESNTFLLLLLLLLSTVADCQNNRSNIEGINFIRTCAAFGEFGCAHLGFKIIHHNILLKKKKLAMNQTKPK